MLNKIILASFTLLFSHIAATTQYTPEAKYRLVFNLPGAIGRAPSDYCQTQIHYGIYIKNALKLCEKFGLGRNLKEDEIKIIKIEESN